MTPSDMMHAERDAAIYQAVKDGRTKKDVSKEYGLSAERVSEICTIQAYVEANPDVLPLINYRELPAIALLVSRGFTVIPPKR